MSFIGIVARNDGWYVYFTPENKTQILLIQGVPGWVQIKWDLEHFLAIARVAAIFFQVKQEQQDPSPF